ncbi:MAG: hypothetical protein GY811_26100, partial [Myxococcales bacterium]|nr:hypothetical protein [Myxococcales bacterium]
MLLFHVCIAEDPSEVPLHAGQEERFFHGYYRHYCYLPMYVYCGEYTLSVQMRPSKIDGAKGAKKICDRIITSNRPGEEFATQIHVCNARRAGAPVGCAKRCGGTSIQRDSLSDTEGMELHAPSDRQSRASIERSEPSFCRTSLSSKEFERRYVYEEVYCARGVMENRIKEVQLDLFGDRASCHTFRGNALRLWFAMAA